MVNGVNMIQGWAMIYLFVYQCFILWVRGCQQGRMPNIYESYLVQHVLYNVAQIDKNSINWVEEHTLGSYK